jgi:NifB/MoaA-like Fe-S oxidoreductase
VEYQPDPKNIHGTGGSVSHVVPDSIAAELGIQPGDVVLAANGLRLRDVIDYRFAIADEQVELLVRGADGEMLYDIEKDPDEDLGLDFTEPLFDRLRTCNNKCPFCFLTQMPKGMRKTLYLKDDDYRLSFLYNNFVTLTNLTEEDWQRIEQQRLSPLHISVHATDRALRAVLLGKKDVPDVLTQIERLGAAGIEVHTQVVACPGLNDGAALQQTIYELAARYPVVQSISVVPVGLTRFRFNGKAPQSVRTAIEVHETPEWINTNWERQPLWNENQSSTDWGFCSRLGAATDVPLRCYRPDEAARLLDSVLPFRERYAAELGLSLVYPSDEFYLLCGRDLPPAAFYDDFPQYSNGVGMTRDLLDEWATARRRLPARLAQPLRVALVCGTLIAPTLEQMVTRLNHIAGLDVRLLPVVNEFFGETVTVSGLLMAQDVIPALRESGCDHAVLPRVMFDHQGTQTLDGIDPRQIAEDASLSVAVVDGAAELVRHISHLARAGLPDTSVAA